MDTKITNLLQEIKKATGWSEPKIAAELGTSQPTVNRILNGQDECKVSTFRAITELHASVVKSKAAYRASDAAGTNGGDPVGPP
jgi:transcriptional regulator with XRE-family HTH domain